MVFVLQTFLQIYDLTCKIRTIEQKSYEFVQVANSYEFARMPYT